MKKLIFTLLILITPYLVNAQASKKRDMRGKIGISLYGGGNIPTNGDYSSSVKAADFLGVGSQFGLGVSYFITRGLGVEGTIYGGYNYYRDKYKPSGKDPLLVNFSSSLNVIYNFGHMFKKPVISPIARIGAGSYQWEHFEDGLLSGDITKDNNNHNFKSFGFNVGAGAEYSLKKNFTIGLMIDYNVFFPKQENQTADNVTDERTTYGFFAPQIKISYYIPTR